MGLAAAVIGSAVVGAGATIVASNSTKNAAENTAATNNALEQQIYNSNKGTLQPFVDDGSAASHAQASFLNGGGSPGSTATAVSAPAQAASSSIVVNGHPVPISATPPANPAAGQLWVDKSAGAPILRAWDGSAHGWAGAGTEEQQKMLLGGATLQQALSSPAPGAGAGAGAGSAAGGSGSGSFPASIQVNGVDIPVSSGPPAHPTSKTAWVDISTGKPVLRAYDASNRSWATIATPAQQQHILGGQTLDGLMRSSATSSVAGPTNAGLKSFADSAGLSGPRDAIASTLGTSEADYLARTGQDVPTNQLSRLYGGSLSDYEKNTGQGKDIAQIEGQLGGNFDQYMEHSGAAAGENANDQFLGLGGGGGYDGYLGHSGVKGYNDEIDKFLGIGAGGLGDYLKSTGYDFTRGQALDAATQSAAATGMLHSGGTLKACRIAPPRSHRPTASSTSAI
jgi:hypothetical protein